MTVPIELVTLGAVLFSGIAGFCVIGVGLTVAALRRPSGRRRAAE